MCGRFAIVSPVHELIEAFGLALAPDDLPPKYNAAPSQRLPVIPNRSPRALELFRWGLVPFWAKEAKIGNRMINARSETLADKPSFKNALKRRRCLVPADGFYEWKKTADGKQPHFIKLRSGAPMALAGLWERWDKGDEPLFSFTIVTTTPNPLMAKLHHRMPVILPERAWARWLDPDPVTPGALAGMFEPYPADEMEAFAVSTRVNSPANDGPQLIQPV